MEWCPKGQRKMQENNENEEKGKSAGNKSTFPPSQHPTTSPTSFIRPQFATSMPGTLTEEKEELLFGR
jgi:hypothetical protein